MAVANTMFQQHPRRLYTWASPDGNTRNQIDYISIAQRWKTSLMNCRTYQGADCDTDHQLLVATLKVRLAITAQHSASKSRGTQGKESSTLCNRGDQQVYSIARCTGWGNPRKSVERYQDHPAGSDQRNDWIRQVVKEKEMDIWWHLRSNQGKERLSLIHIWRCRRSTLCRSRWSPYH